VYTYYVNKNDDVLLTLPKMSIERYGGKNGVAWGGMMVELGQ